MGSNPNIKYNENQFQDHHILSKLTFMLIVQLGTLSTLQIFLSSIAQGQNQKCLLPAEICILSMKAIPKITHDIQTFKQIFSY